MRKVREAIAQEIRYCLFYGELQARTTEPHFNKWTFVKREDAEIKQDWMKPAGDRWIKANGRVKAIIEIVKPPEGMTKITLEFHNDTPTIKFYERSNHPVPTFHLRSEVSIASKIKELKHQADVFLEERRHPQFGGGDEQALRKLLHID